MIREATKNDVLKICELGTLVNKNFQKLFDIESILKEEYSKIFVYEDNNKIIGFLHITILYETVDIINIVVDKDYRHQGIASNLLDHMMSFITTETKIITLEVNVNNIFAINLYKKFGFEIINQRKDYYDDGDAYLMGRILK